MIRLYHGSNVKIEVPDLVHSKPFKDFGRGFYLSADKQQAWDMAFQKVNQTKEGKAEVTEFLFDETFWYRTSIKAIEETMTTKLTPEQRQLLKDELSVEIAGFLVDDYKYSPEEAIDVLYTSETFDRLQDDATGLYYQSPGYVYSFLQNELKTAKVE